MLKISSYDIVAQEIPDEITLALNLSGCPFRCAGCHSPWLQTDCGKELTSEMLHSLVECYASAITCVCFMGGDGDPNEVVRLAKEVRAAWPTMKTAWYSGRELLPQELECSFDYVKSGPYIAKAGGLKDATTNQRLYAILPNKERRVLLPKALRGTLLMLALLFLCGCTDKSMHSGDLLFCYGEGDLMEQAITQSTGDDAQKSYTHVGIVLIQRDSTFVLEAIPDKGVCLTPIDTFMDRANTYNGKPAVDLMRVSMDDASLRASIERAKSYLGRPYDYLYLPDDNEIYCSELVWLAYKDSTGKQLFETIPMNFKAKDGSIPAYWLQLYAIHNRPIPQGTPGTNPNSIAQSPMLKRVTTKNP